MNSIKKIEITDRQSFIKFLEILRNDLNANQDQWTNQTLDDFLEAMTRYAEDIQGYYDNQEKETGEHINADIPSWRTFADILKGARIYE
jgi:hypothetical protein